MEYMGNESYWNKKFENRGGNLLKPEEALVTNIKYLKSGTVLDLACGDGRNSLFLLKEGFSVTGVDFSIKALERLVLYEKMNTIKIDTTNKELKEVVGEINKVIKKQ